MDFDIRKIDLAKLNSMTKYPSIPTYHAMGERGVLQEHDRIQFAGRVVATEKIDGTNCRIIFCPDGSIIVGSRENLLWEQRDLLGDKCLGIVDTVRDVVSRASRLPPPDFPFVCYCEVYGKGIQSGGNYSKTTTSLRLFDVAGFPNYEQLMFLEPTELAARREHRIQEWSPEYELKYRAEELGIQCAPTVFDHDASGLPETIDATLALLIALGNTQCAIGDDTPGEPEGIVIRTQDRKVIAKARRQDYRKTVKAMASAR